MKWPESLQQDLMVDGFSEDFASNAVRTKMDQGPAFQRPLYGVNDEPISGSIQVDKSEHAVFKQFWRDLSYGAIPFDWKHPITGEPKQVQFDTSTPPKTTPIARSGLLFSIAFKIEILP